jgi:hypothetical protein
MRVRVRVGVILEMVFYSKETLQRSFVFSVCAIWLCGGIRADIAAFDCSREAITCQMCALVVVDHKSNDRPAINATAVNIRHVLTITSPYSLPKSSSGHLLRVHCGM